jgi:23S rRNA (guanosine2251-2'-O)-methyltransferase
VTEVLRARLRQVERVWVADDRRAGIGRLLRIAREAGVPVTHLPRRLLAQKVGHEAAHQGIAASVAPIAYADPAEVCRRALTGAGLLVLLDGVSDPRNLGAALRTCAAAGVDGVLLGGEGTAGLGPAAIKASAGAVERLPVAREPRPAARLEELAGASFAVVALDPRGPTPWDALDLRGRVVLVAGGESRGVRPGLLRVCNARVAIPVAPAVDSLNVAVALGVLLFEAVRQRRASTLESDETR